MRKVYVVVETRLIINADEGVNIEDVLSDMDYTFTSTTEGVDIVDTEIRGWDVQDSK